MVGRRADWAAERRGKAAAGFRTCLKLVIFTKLSLVLKLFVKHV
jgi:hypothetical protein